MPDIVDELQEALRFDFSASNPTTYNAPEIPRGSNFYGCGEQTQSPRRVSLHRSGSAVSDYNGYDIDSGEEFNLPRSRPAKFNWRTGAGTEPYRNPNSSQGGYELDRHSDFDFDHS